jgi:hypothetical protein
MNHPVRIGQINVTAVQYKRNDRPESHINQRPTIHYSTSSQSTSFHSEMVNYIYLTRSDAHETNVVDASICPGCKRPNCKPLVFDSLSKQLFGDPSTAFGFWVWDNWKTCPRTLYSEAHRLGYERVRDEVWRVRKMRGLDDHGAYLRACLRKMT